jgi:biopolymer transport protein TolR
MAQIEDSSGGRETNVELNLVPFIDLMSVCIIFLLITAVWTQVSMIQIGSSLHARQTENDEPPPKEEDKTNIKLQVDKSGYTVIVGGRSVHLPKVKDDFDDAGLLSYMKQIKEKFPKKTQALIALVDEMTYENLIRGMDALMQGGFPEISVSTGER